MISMLSLLIAGAFAAPSHVPMGSLAFYNTTCPDYSTLGEMYDLRDAPILSPPNKLELSSFIWHYADDTTLEFYENQDATEPYATIVGPKETLFGQHYCGFQKSDPDAQPTERQPLFLSEDSFIKIIPH
jgi:hypothetical protein